MTEAMADVVKQGVLRHGLACSGGGREGDCRDKRVSISIEGEGENQGKATTLKGMGGWGRRARALNSHFPQVVSIWGVARIIYTSTFISFISAIKKSAGNTGLRCLGERLC